MKKLKGKKTQNSVKNNFKNLKTIWFKKIKIIYFYLIKIIFLPYYRVFLDLFFNISKGVLV
jgi:hypothetical protein